jgi:glycosyltransferase involved in cell wall biosynthesis
MTTDNSMGSAANINSKVSAKISVYMPSKNRGPMVKRAIDSVMSQNYPNFELVVVDDGSTDDTPALLEEYARRYDNFSYYRHEESRGVAAARNLAIEKSTGEFVTGIDDDDSFAPERLSSLMAAYDDKYAFVCSSVVWDFGHRQKIADDKAMVFSLSDQLSYNHATTQVLVRKERMVAICGFDTTLTARIDYDAWTCLMEKFGDAKRINPPSYILSRNAGVERITTTERNICGNHQFVKKHQARMTAKNLANQSFWDMYAQNQKFGLGELVRQVLAGNALTKLKFFIRVHFLPNWHK